MRARLFVFRSAKLQSGNNRIFTTKKNASTIVPMKVAIVAAFFGFNSLKT